MQPKRSNPDDVVASNDSDDISKAIADLYVVFRSYRLAPHIDACPCCVGDEDQAAIRRVELRLLTSADLNRYAWKAVTTWGSVNDLKHFLPRILELLATDGAWGIDAEIVFGKIESDWHGWPKLEQAAIRRFLLAAWNRMLTRDMTLGCFENLGSLLCCIGKVEDDLSMYLEQCEFHWRHASCCRHVASLVNENADTIIRKNRLGSAFWYERLGPEKQVIDWVCRPEIGDRLEEAFFRYSNESFASELSEAVELHGTIRRSQNTLIADS